MPPIDYERLPPHNIEAEEAVIGSLLVDFTAIHKIITFLKPDSFYRERNQWLYGACISLYEQNVAINQITVAEELTRRGKLEDVGGIAYLSRLVSILPTSVHIEHYAKIVHNLSGMRQLIGAAGQIAAIGYEASGGFDEAIEQSRKLIEGIRQTKSRHLELTNMKILKSTPPHYRLNVNGRDMKLSIYELKEWGKFKTKVLSELDFIPIKPKNWEGLINQLLDIAQKEEAPADTSVEVGIKLSVRSWFEQKGEGKEHSDIRSGSYVVVPYLGKETNFESKEYWAFQPTPLLRWLKRDFGNVISRDNLWAMARDWGVVKHQWRVGKGNSIPLKLWALPPDFAVSAEFAIEKEEKQEELPVKEIEGEEELPDI